MINLKPEGMVVAHGLIATTLRDFAHYAMLFTSNWHKAAHERVVSPEVLKRIRIGGNSAAYKKGETYRDHLVYFGQALRGGQDSRLHPACCQDPGQ